MFPASLIIISEMIIKTCENVLETTKKEIAENQTKNDATHNKRNDEVRKQIENLEMELKIMNDTLSMY